MAAVKRQRRQTATTAAKRSILLLLLFAFVGVTCAVSIYYVSHILHPSSSDVEEVVEPGTNNGNGIKKSNDPHQKAEDSLGAQERQADEKSKGGQLPAASTSERGIDGERTLEDSSEGKANGEVKKRSSSSSTSSSHKIPWISASCYDLKLDQPCDASTTLSSQQKKEVTAIKHDMETGNFHSRASCIENGMQRKCLFTNFVVEKNQFYVVGSRIKKDYFPNPIFPPDGQRGPLKQYHKYTGHHVGYLNVPSKKKEKEEEHDQQQEEKNNNQEGEDKGKDDEGKEHVCRYLVTRPTVFLYRMSGHSTYHLWENNLGPFFSTLQESFSPDKGRRWGSSEKKQTPHPLVEALNDPKRLMIAFTDNKPTKGPKAPILLDKLLRTFSDVNLINASMLHEKTCFTQAVVGISSNSFPHKQLLYRMMKNVAGYSPPSPLPQNPSVLYISRNHKSVIRGRKIANEAAFLEALNRTILDETNGEVQVRKVFMEDYSFEEQIKLSMKTNIMFSPHGGGVANCIWMREGSVMMEFVAPVGKTLTNMYHTMCGKSGVTHSPFLAKPDPADAKVDLKGNARLFSNMIVPPETIEKEAKKALALYRKNYQKAVQEAAKKKRDQKKKIKDSDE